MNNQLIKNTWHLRHPFYIGVVATMSAGKSTLLNALIGQEWLYAANETATAKITTIVHGNTSQSAYGSAQLKNGNIIQTSQLTEQILRAWNADADIQTVTLHLKLNRLCATQSPHDPQYYPVLFDTPGPNNSQDRIHTQTTYHFLQHQPLNLLVYILNATQIGIQDDKHFLQHIQSIRQQQAYPTPILFVLNKIDVLDPEKGETLENILQNCHRYLESLDFRLPEIIPVAAYQALLALKWMADTPLRRREKIELRQYLHHLVETDEIKNMGLY